MHSKKSATGYLIFILIAIFIVITVIFLFNVLAPLAKMLGTIDVIYFFIMCFAISNINRTAALAKLSALASPATLVEKTMEHRRHHSLHFLVFELDDGNRKLFQVDRDTYAKVLESEKGILTYKEKGKLIEYISFARGIPPKA